MEKTEFTTELVEAATLLKSFKNPRKIDERSLEELKGQILADPTFLLRRPILASRVNGLLVVYAGNQRLAACLSLGLKQVPVRIEDNVDKDLLNRRMLLDNVSRGEFIEESLVKNFQDQLTMLQDSKVFKDMEYLIETKRERVTNTLVSTKLVFQIRDELNLFYTLLDDLAVRYPEQNVSQRLVSYLLAMDETGGVVS